MLDHAVAFAPLPIERVWGGRRLEHWGKPLPAEGPIGESWELVDRADAQSVVAGGPRSGTTLHALWTDERASFGTRAGEGIKRFPLLVKLLDATETLSVQVHPPKGLADELGGEPKTEMWFLAEATPQAHLFAGLATGVTRERFAAALKAGDDVSTMLHRLPVTAGDAIFIPSGRVHAIGAGCVIFEIQQNSDTTYRVFDFNRPGLDGQPRPLHVGKGLASIDFDDIEPGLATPDGDAVGACEHFAVSRWALNAPRRATAEGECAVVCVLNGTVRCGPVTAPKGTTLLVPATALDPALAPEGDRADVLVVELPER